MKTGKVNITVYFEKDLKKKNRTEDTKGICQTSSHKQSKNAIAKKRNDDQKTNRKEYGVNHISTEELKCKN